MGTELFFQDLPGFTDFRRITDDSLFREVGDDWVVFVTDVVGSTKAIETGRYRDVNTLGAAAIACAQNVMPGFQFPFVFGGDGATLLVPVRHAEEVRRRLLGLQSLARERFGMELRAGMVRVKDVRAHGLGIQVAKHELVPGKAVAIFRGGGLSVAENKIKLEPLKYELAEHRAQAPDLTGLSCRWQPIEAENGVTLSILVSAHHPDTYKTVLDKLDEIFDGNLEEANPVKIGGMTYKSIRQCFADEKRYHTSFFRWSFFYRLFEIVMAVLIFKVKLPIAPFDSSRYARSMKTHSDYRKFDDMLRMVVDCSTHQKSQIEHFLNGLYEKGDLCYGLHGSSAALMTCLVQNVIDGQHLHFIDGAGGGYAMASKQLKEQMRRAVHWGAA